MDNNKSSSSSLSTFMLHKCTNASLIKTLALCRAGVAKWFTALCCSMCRHGLEPPLMLVDTCSASTWIKQGLAAMLTSVRLAGVTPEVNLRITQVREHTSKGIYPCLKPRADITRSPKHGYQ